MGTATAVLVMLYGAAALQIVAAVVALLLIPLSGMRVSWMLICAALVLQAYRRVDAVTSHATLREAITALAVSILLLAGIVGIRSVFLSMRKTRGVLDREIGRDQVVSNRAGAAIVVLDTDGRIREMNDMARELTASRGRDAVGEDWFATFVPPGIRDDVRKAFERLVASSQGNDEYVQNELIDLAGNRHVVIWHRRTLSDADGRITGVRSAGIDLTERSLLEKDVAFRSVLLDKTNDSVVVYRYDGTIVYANSVACDYRGASRDAIVGSNIRSLMPEGDAERLSSFLQGLRGGACVTFDTEAVGRDGVVRPLESHTCGVWLGDEQLVVDVSRDITERREAESALRRMAYTDPLTGLANRVRLADRASVSLARAQRSEEHVAFLFMDLDRIKTVNDTFGHGAGDGLLQQVGQRLAGVFREEDTVGRVGGDEFVAFARVGGTEDAETVARRLVELMAEPFATGDATMSVTASVGVALYPSDGEDFDELVSKADAAMYVAKGRGRNGYWLYSFGDGSAEASG